MAPEILVSSANYFLNPRKAQKSQSSYEDSKPILTTSQLFSVFICPIGKNFRKRPETENKKREPPKVKDMCRWS